MDKRTSLARRIALSLVAAVTLLAGPLIYATIWGPLGVPPLGVYRDVAFYGCSTGTPVYFGYEQWECDRTFTQGGTSARHAMATDTNCTTGAESITYWCKTATGGWRQITATEFEWCDPCAKIGH